MIPGDFINIEKGTIRNCFISHDGIRPLTKEEMAAMSKSSGDYREYQRGYNEGYEAAIKELTRIKNDRGASNLIDARHKIMFDLKNP